MSNTQNSLSTAALKAAEIVGSLNIQRDQIRAEHLALEIRELSRERQAFRVQFAKQALSICDPSQKSDSEPLWGVIVETRPIPALEESVLSIMNRCHIPIQLFHGSENYRHIMESRLGALVASGELTLTRLDLPKRIPIAGYNALLLSPLFWNALIGRRKVLIFQHDSLCCNNSPYSAFEFLNFDYIGAPWSRKRPIGLVIDGGVGGFSLRDWAKCYESLERFSAASWAGGEDGFFAFHLDLMGASVASMEQGAMFATQSQFTSLSFGAHRIGFLNNQDLKRFVTYCPEALRVFPHLTRRATLA
jgi:hypothetical protein